MRRTGLLSQHSKPPKKQEEYYMDRNVKTAIAIDEWTPGAPITSMVDDVFYIVQKCGRRAISTGNVQSGCAVLGQVNSLLAGELRSALDAKWKVSNAKTMRRSWCWFRSMRRYGNVRNEMRRSSPSATSTQKTPNSPRRCASFSSLVRSSITAQIPATPRRRKRCSTRFRRVKSKCWFPCGDVFR